MVPFDYNLHWKIFKLIRQNPGRVRKGPKTYALIISISILTNIINKFFFLIDDILFFTYRKILIKSPIFIISPPRTGSTFLQRLLCDSQDYTGMYLWECVFAPSITQKYLFLGLGKLDRLFGSPLYKAIHRLEKASELYKIHPLSLFKTEEDAHIFSITGNSPFLIMHYPFTEIQDFFLHFDEKATDAYKNKYMRYYHQCIQKHLFVFGRKKVFVSKNPTFCPYVNTIKQAFVGAKIIYLYRDPQNLVPSTLSLASFIFGKTSYLSKPEITKMTVDTLNNFYLHPARTLDFTQRNNHIIFYHDLTRNTAQTLRQLLERFNLPINPEFKLHLELADQKSKNYKSEHKYSLEESGITQQEISHKFSDVYEHFRYL